MSSLIECESRADYDASCYIVCVVSVCAVVSGSAVW